MLRLIIIFVLVIAVGLFISRIFSRKRDDRVIDGEVIDAESKPNKPSLLPLLFLGLLFEVHSPPEEIRPTITIIQI